MQFKKPPKPAVTKNRPWILVRPNVSDSLLFVAEVTLGASEATMLKQMVNVMQSWRAGANRWSACRSASRTAVDGGGFLGIKGKIRG